MRSLLAVVTPEQKDALHAPTLLDGFKGVDVTQPIVIVALGLVGVAALVFMSMLFRTERGASATGGLNYVVGPMGSGKSMFGVRTIVGALCEGKYVITNVNLLPGWAEKVARKEFPRDRGDRRARRVRWLESLYVYETSLRSAMRYRVPCAKCGRDVKECQHTGPFQESRAVFVWDETHNDLNNRDYQGHGTTREERESERERRRLVIRWATQLRKLGFTGYLLSQHHENTDAQLRRVCNHVIMLQNQRQRGGFGFLMPQRFALFLVYWYPAHLADGSGRMGVKALRFERYFLPWTRVLYDSWETFHGIDDGQDEETTPLVLPAPGKRIVPSPAGRGSGLPESGRPPSAPSLTSLSLTHSSLHPTPSPPDKSAFPVEEGLSPDEVRGTPEGLTDPPERGTFARSGGEGEASVRSWPQAWSS